jgi:ABC-2 type transport system permease protein
MTSTTQQLVLSRRPSLGAIVALVALTLRQQLRGRRLLVLSLLFCLPGLLAAVINFAARVPPPTESLQFGLVFNLIPAALAPLAALLYAAGIIQDEVEEQTLTYLLLRPIPRGALYLARLLAAMLVTALLAGLFTAATFAVIGLTGHTPLDTQTGVLILKTVGLLALAEVAYCGLFGVLGLLLRRSLLLGMGYIVLFEGLLASLDMLARRMTVMYHFRVLVLRLIDAEHAREWSIELGRAPQASTSMWVLLGIGLVMAVIGALIFRSREFRMKTPEGS